MLSTTLYIYTGMVFLPVVLARLISESVKTFHGEREREGKLL